MNNVGGELLSRIGNCDTLILLIGANPLPNYVAASTLKPSKIVMLYTRETKPVMERLTRLIKKKIDPVIVEACHVRRSSVREVREAVSRYATEGTYLNYTGGTKIMAAQARMAFGEAFRSMGGDDCFSLYVDEERSCILFDNGHEVRVHEEEIGLSLEDLAELHDIKANPTALPPDGPTFDDVLAVLRVEVDKPGTIASRLNEWGHSFDRIKTVKGALSCPLRVDTLGVSLSVAQVPGADWTNARFKVWKKFISDNAWLELWVACLVRQATGLVPHWSVNCEIQPLRRPFEIDVALVRGCRLYVISCTTSSEVGLCKSKLFEVGHRARQMGGDLARAALVTFLDGCEPNGQRRINMVQQDVESAWEQPNKPKVFGLADVREWFGYHRDPNPDSLHQWLKR